MRIIAGAFKGRRLASPAWPGLRPTSDKLRETIFNVVGERVRLARVLDACAGTGALGLEALSRGAAHVTFVDASRRSAELIRENLRRCGLENARRRGDAGAPEPYAIIRDDLRRAAKLLAPQEFDLILLDPPYEDPDLERLLGAAGDRLAPGGWLLLERARRRASPGETAGLRRRRTIVSGDSAVDVYELSRP